MHVSFLSTFAFLLLTTYGAHALPPTDADIGEDCSSNSCLPGLICSIADGTTCRIPNGDAGCASKTDCEFGSTPAGMCDFTPTSRRLAPVSGEYDPPPMGVCVIAPVQSCAAPPPARRLEGRDLAPTSNLQCVSGYVCSAEDGNTCRIANGNYGCTANDQCQYNSNGAQGVCENPYTGPGRRLGEMEEMVGSGRELPTGPSGQCVIAATESCGLPDRRRVLNDGDDERELSISLTCGSGYMCSGADGDTCRIANGNAGCSSNDQCQFNTESGRGICEPRDGRRLGEADGRELAVGGGICVIAPTEQCGAPARRLLEGEGGAQERRELPSGYQCATGYFCSYADGGTCRIDNGDSGCTSDDQCAYSTNNQSICEMTYLPRRLEEEASGSRQLSVTGVCVIAPTEPCGLGRRLLTEGRELAPSLQCPTNYVCSADDAYTCRIPIGSTGCTSDDQCQYNTEAGGRGICEVSAPAPDRRLEEGGGHGRELSSGTCVIAPAKKCADIMRRMLTEGRDLITDQCASGYICSFDDGGTCRLANGETGCTSDEQCQYNSQNGRGVCAVMIYRRLLEKDGQSHGRELAPSGTCVIAAGESCQNTGPTRRLLESFGEQKEGARRELPPIEDLECAPGYECSSEDGLTCRIPNGNSGCSTDEECQFNSNGGGGVCEFDETRRLSEDGRELAVAGTCKIGAGQVCNVGRRRLEVQKHGRDLASYPLECLSGYSCDNASNKCLIPRGSSINCMGNSTNCEGGQQTTPSAGCDPVDNLCKQLEGAQCQMLYARRRALREDVTKSIEATENGRDLAVLWPCMPPAECNLDSNACEITGTQTPTSSPVVTAPTISPTNPRYEAFGAGDPHFRMLNGTLITCNDLGFVDFLSASDWQSTIYVFPVGAGSAISNFTVQFLVGSPVTPSLTIDTSGWTPTVYNAGTQYEMILTDTLLTLSAYATAFSIQVTGNHLDINMATQDVPLSGTLLDGCLGGEVDVDAAIPGGVVDECSGLQEPFASFCTFDFLESGNDTDFVTSATFMEETVTTFIPTASPTDYLK